MNNTANTYIYFRDKRRQKIRRMVIFAILFLLCSLAYCLYTFRDFFLSYLLDNLQ